MLGLVLGLRNGLAAVGAQPGLGVTLDEAAVARYQARGDEIDLPERLVIYTRANGLQVVFAGNSHNSSSVWTYFRQGSQPVMERGAAMTAVDVDDDPELRRLYDQALATGPIVMHERG